MDALQDQKLDAHSIQKLDEIYTDVRSIKQRINQPRATRLTAAAKLFVLVVVAVDSYLAYTASEEDRDKTQFQHVVLTVLGTQFALPLIDILVALCGGRDE